MAGKRIKTKLLEKINSGHTNYKYFIGSLYQPFNSLVLFFYLLLTDKEINLIYLLISN